MVSLPRRSCHRSFNPDQKLTACLLGFRSFGVSRATFVPEARRVRSNDRKARLVTKLRDIAIASFETPVSSGRSRTRTPFASRTPTTLALIASDNSDWLSNSRAKANRSCERSADGGLPSPSSRGADAVCLLSGPRLNSPYPRIGRQSGSSKSSWPTTAPRASRKLVDLVLAETLLPAFLDDAEQGSPDFLCLAAGDGGANHPRGARRTRS